MEDGTIDRGYMMSGVDRMRRKREARTRSGTRWGVIRTGVRDSRSLFSLSFLSLAFALISAPLLLCPVGATCMDNFDGFKAALADAGADNPEFKTYATILSSLNSCDDLIHSPLLAMARLQGMLSPGENGCTSPQAKNVSADFCPVTCGACPSATKDAVIVRNATCPER